MSSAENISPSRLDRRAAIKWMMTAAAVVMLDPAVFGARQMGTDLSTTVGRYGTDPDLLKTYKPGDLWPLTLSGPQRAAVTKLCDVIIPADANGPSASAVGVPDFIDEWISAPYAGHNEDRKTILEGLAWFDTEANTRFSKNFIQLDPTQTKAVCDDICYVPKAKPERKTAAQFFKRFRDLTAGGYYTTPPGMKAIGYVGNVPLVTFEGPPPEALKKLGLL